jgi:hypothetical protein
LFVPESGWLLRTKLRVCVGATWGQVMMSFRPHTVLDTHSTLPQFMVAAYLPTLSKGDKTQT